LRNSEQEVVLVNVLEAIAKRRSVRTYRPDPIPEPVVDRLLSAMRLAPSGGNRQAWKFVAVR
jgi:nitroreductase